MQNTRVKPHTKLIAPGRGFLLLLLLPAKYDIYIGSIGSIQGDMKDIIPSRKVMIYCILASPLFITTVDAQYEDTSILRSVQATVLHSLWTFR